MAPSRLRAQLRNPLARFGQEPNNADVATVLALDEPAKALLEAIKAAQSAIDRLDAAGYAGAEWV